MTISTTVDNITSGPYPGDGTNAQFSYTFKAIAATDLQVYEDNGTTSTLLTVNSDYTVNDLGSENGGTIDRVAGNLPTGSTWFIVADYKQVQATVFGSQGAFLSAIHEAAFDRIIMLILQIERKSNLALRLPASYTGDASVELPIPVADRGFKWDAAGTALETTLTNPDEVATSVDASAAAAAVSAAAASVSQTAVAVDLVATNADVVSTGEDVLSAEAWANHDEDVLIPSAVGGDEVDDYSAKHHAAKAEDWANQAGTKINLRNCVQNQEAVNQTTTPVAGMSSTSYTGDVTSNRDIDLNLDMASGDNGGLVIVKDRGNSASHFLHCSLFSTGQILQTDTTVAQTTYPNSFDSFTTTGMRLGVNTAVNNARNYIAWAHATTHKKSGTTNTGRAYTCHYNPKTGLSLTLVEAGTSDGSQKIPSHLNQKTELVTIKALDAVSQHVVSHESFGNGDYMAIDANAGVVNSATNNIEHVETGVIISGSDFNFAGRFLVIQKHSVEGYSKIGIYNPSGVAGWEFDLGFKPGYSHTKSLAVGEWGAVDVVRDFARLKSDLPDAEVTGTTVEFTDTGLVFVNSHTSYNALGVKFLVESYADSSTDGTHSQADYDEPTSPDTVNIVEGSIVSFAEGFNANGTLDSTLTIGASMTYQIPNGTPEGKSYLYIDKLTGAIGLTQVPYAEGRSRKLADHWGTESIDGLRTADVHSGYQSTTGVVSASGEDGTDLAWKAFDKSTSSLSFWQNPTAAASWLQYTQNEPRTLKSWRMRERNAISDQTPLRFTIEGSNDGANWVAIDSTYTSSDYVGNGVELWGDLQDTSANTTAYLHHRINITATNGGSQTTISELEFNTSAPLGDFYNIVTGITVDSTDTPVQRVYLTTLDIDTEGHAANIENYPVARLAVNDLDVYGKLTTHSNVKVLDFGVVNQNTPYILPNPFGDENWKGCTAVAYILLGGKWHISGTYNASSNMWHTTASVTTDGIEVSVGTQGVSTVRQNSGGTWTGSNTTNAPCKVVVTFNGRTRDV